MRRILTAAAAVALLVTGVTEAKSTSLSADDYIPPVLGGIYGVGANGPGSYAVLIDVHAIKKDPARPSGGTANCSNAQPSNGGYALTGWQVASALTAHLTVSTVPSSLGSVTAAMQSSWNAWPYAPRVTVANDGTVTRYTANRSYDLLFGRTGGSLATTYTWRWNDGTVESDTVFDTGVTWFQAASEGDGCIETAGNKYDVANIATHEFGHSYGLDHPAGDRFETMYAYGYSGETLKRSPSTGDSAGANALY
ncbi:MAG TPA: matrixin family metalloprotease [Acidimicrobiales bacterium]|nr:matrixin family metalloprotease [Acidimicrobiales bacterium]